MSSIIHNRNFTRRQYHELAATGELQPDQRVELIDGEITPMSPIGARHAHVVNHLTRLLTRACPEAWLSVQNPIALGEDSEPQPDLALLKPRQAHYATHTPQAEDVLLLIEVMDTSHDMDLLRKQPLYAQYNIVEVWFPDLPGEVWHVCRDPKQPGEYSSRQRITDKQTVSPENFPELSFTLPQLLGETTS